MDADTRETLTKIRKARAAAAKTRDLKLTRWALAFLIATPVVFFAYGILTGDTLIDAALSTFKVWYGELMGVIATELLNARSCE